MTAQITITKVTEVKEAISIPLPVCSLAQFALACGEEIALRCCYVSVYFLLFSVGFQSVT